LSPTGSGKTLAAFLWGIDELFRELIDQRRRSDNGDAKEGVRLLYVSPLKALNNDVERNLRAPLEGIRRTADEQSQPLPRLDVLVRTGDTPQSVRRRMVKHPPHVLITTPESLYLILTSPVARDMFRTVRTVILDEIHTLVGNKRGVHLALSLERVLELTETPVQRIGLSATQRPLEEVARFLGGAEWQGSGSGRALVPRPVTIVDVGMVKPMDLKVVTSVESFRELPGGSIWPAIIPQVMDLIETNRTTLIFANSRRQAERAADRLNDLFLARQSGRGNGPDALIEGGAVKASGFQGTGTVGGPFRAHHGSVSREARMSLEQALKAGKLPALVGTSSLELGIDIGSVDLVVQLQSPKGVARGLQRVGRSGHLVGETSVGRLFATHREDLLESAAIARAMTEGDVEPSYTPLNSLDVLAQQIVAMVSVEDRDVSALFDLVQRAYPYHKLTLRLFRSVLDMLSGRYPSTAFRELRPRIALDRVHDRLAALPGSRLLAIRNGGTIPDRGSFGAYLPDRKTKLGELDEEFVYETRPGDVITLGANTWRVQDVTEDRVVVSPAPGYLPRMPFWKGDAPRRDYHLGCIYGRFRRELSRRCMASQPEAMEWLRDEFHLDVNSAQNAVAYVQRQIDALGTISSDRTIIAELFTDALGDRRLVIHSCFGARVNSPWALALAHGFREALGSQPEVMVTDDGILFRFLETDRPPPLGLLREMGAVEARERVLGELPNSAVFGAQFRMNAARALLLPAARGTQKRTPFWLQRLRAKDLLAVAKGFDDFPIITETYRDCLRDVLDMANLEEVLHGIQSAEIEVREIETVVPSPVASSLLHDLIAQYMYEWDQPKAEQQMQALLVGRETLSQILNEASLPDILRPEVVRDVDDRLQHLADGTRARTPEELTTLFLALGDLSLEEAAARSDGDGEAWVDALIEGGHLERLDLPAGPRYVLPEQAETYRAAFRAGVPEEVAGEARRAILRRLLSTRGPLTRDALLSRYPAGAPVSSWIGLPADWLDTALASLVDSGEIVTGRITPGASSKEFCDRRNLERIHRQTLALLRKEVEPVSIQAHSSFLARWQHVHPAERLAGPGGLVRLLQKLRGIPAPGVVWERDVLPLRLRQYDPRELEQLCQRGEVVWVGSGGKDPRRARVRFLFRGEGHLFLAPEPAGPELTPAADEVLAFLKREGACFYADLQEGLDLPASTMGTALAELVMAGLVTNDTLQALREVLSMQGETVARQKQPLSSLAAELEAWKGDRQPAHRLGHRPPGRARLHSAKRAAARRVERRTGPVWTGRWSLVHSVGVWGRPVTVEERLERQARQLLHCFGIVTRQSLEASREGSSWNWGELYHQFQRMEMRGEVRRGYFVQGLPGVQFALPEAVERLREWSGLDAAPAEDLVLLSSCDPANLFGPSESQVERQTGTRNDPSHFARIPANYTVQLGGRPILLLELGAERLTTQQDLSPETLRQALELAVGHAGALDRRLVVAEWNQEPVLESRLAPVLERTGFRREALVFVWDG
jgi:ATP-dependent Lhr-like helicase